MMQQIRSRDRGRHWPYLPRRAHWGPSGGLRCHQPPLRLAHGPGRLNTTEIEPKTGQPDTTPGTSLKAGSPLTIRAPALRAVTRMIASARLAEAALSRNFA